LASEPYERDGGARERQRRPAAVQDYGQAREAGGEVPRQLFARHLERIEDPLGVVTVGRVMARSK
jgi:hypothetical protein